MLFSYMPFVAIFIVATFIVVVAAVAVVFVVPAAFIVVDVVTGVLH